MISLRISIAAIQFRLYSRRKQKWDSVNSVKYFKNTNRIKQHLCNNSWNLNRTPAYNWLFHVSNIS